MNKITYTLATLITLAIVLTTSSCKKQQEHSWAEINGGSAQYYAYNKQYNILDYNGNVDTDTLIISININYSVDYANSTFINELNPFYGINNDYEPVLKHSISNITLRSDYDFNNYNAGEPLNDIVEVLENPFFGITSWNYSNTISLQEYAYKHLVQMTKVYYYSNQLFIKFKEKPIISTQKFELDFVDSQGTHFYIKLKKVNWI